MSKLNNKVAVITGAADGIGRATALAFAQEGSSLVINDLNAEGLEETARLIGTHRPVSTVVGDAGSEDCVSGLVKLAVEQHGRLDIMFANAGIGGPDVPLPQITLDGWDKLMRVNLTGVFLAVREASTMMAELGNGGSIICTSSVAGLRARGGGLPYGVAKAGVINLCKYAAHHLTGKNIRVNAVCPGLIETGLTKQIFDGARAAGQEDTLRAMQPLARYGTPQDVARLVTFLASDDSDFINGEAITVDGGLSALLATPGP